jgi:tetratricopeptide (TPR) repeat protein
LEYFSAVKAKAYGFAIRAGLTLAVAALIVNFVAPALSGVLPSPANDERLLGVVYEVQGKGSIALDQFDRAVKMEPRNQTCRLSLASMLASDGVADEAERQFLVAASLDTLSPTPHLGLANLYRRNGLYEQALYSLQAAQTRAPYDVGLAVSLGRSCVEMSLYEQAEMYFRKALELNPENISAIDGLLELRDRGVNLRVSDEGEERPESVRVKIREAMALIRAGEMEGAKELLDEAEAAAPDDLDVVFAVATWHLQNGEPEEAIEGYERCLEANPKNTIVMNNLGAAYQQTGRSEEAMALWRRILSLDPANARAKANLERLESGGEQKPSESP